MGRIGGVPAGTVHFFFDQFRYSIGRDAAGSHEGSAGM